MIRELSIFAVCASICGVSCGGGQTQGNAFDPKQREDGPAMAALQKQLAGVKIPLGAQVAVGVFSDKSLVGVRLDGSQPWTYEHAITCRPVLAGQVVVGVGANEMFGLDAKTGKQLWVRKSGGCLRGAADDGKITVVSVQPVTGYGGIVLAVGRDGQVIRQIEDEANIGAPGLVDGVLFLPWDGRYVSAYDLSVGEEVARIQLAGAVTTRAFASGGALFFGEQSVARFDETIGRSSGIATLTLPGRVLPDSPVWATSGNDTLPPRAVPSDRARLYALPASTGPLQFASNRYVATHGRVAMGLDLKDATLVWARANTANFIGGAAYEGGFALCDADGKVTFLDAQTGAVAGSVSLGVPIDACLVQADGFAKTKTEPRPLRDSIAEVLRLKLSDDVPIQRFLLHELTVSPDERATETLIRMVEDGSAAAEIAPEVRAALSARTVGTDYMLSALAKRPDFWDGAGVTRYPPIGPLADALGSMGERRASPLLADYLVDPAVPAQDLERVAAALAVIGGPEELPALRWFFAAYRSEASEMPIVLAVAHVARGLQRLGAGNVVTEASSDPFTSDAVRAKLSAQSPAAPR